MQRGWVAARPSAIVSGGQSGVDRAALDVAIECGIPYRGWCPRGGWAEDMPDPPGLLARYPGLLATPAREPAERTRLNVRDSDATLILTMGPAASPGTALAEREARALARPLALVDLAGSEADQEDRIRELLEGLPGARALNVAGPRESEAPGIYRRAARLLGAAFG